MFPQAVRRVFFGVSQMVGSTRRKDAKVNTTDRYFAQEYPSAEQIEEQKRIQDQIDAERLAKGFPDGTDESNRPRQTKVYSTRMLPSGSGVLRGQG